MPRGTGVIPRVIDSPDFAKAFSDSVKEAVDYKVCYRYTDRQIYMRINQQLMKRGLRIPLRTYQDWMTAYINSEDWVFKNHYVFKAFAHIENAMLEAQDYLIDRIENDRSWQRYSWLLERRFKQWQLDTNLNLNSEVTHNVQLVLNMPKDVPVITEESDMLNKYDYVDYELSDGEHEV